MKSQFKFTALLAVLVALLALAPAAMAKHGGGGGGGGGTCATIDSLTFRITETGGAIDAVVTMGCFDEHSGTVAFDYRDARTGTLIGRSVITSSLGTRTYSQPTSWPSATSPAVVVTVTVTAPNGKIQDTESIAIGG